MGYYDNYLEHHGILGQKWGVRRFESANGHLTAAGLKRYADGRKVTAKEQNAGLSVKKKSPSKVDSTGKKENSKEETTEKKGLTDKQKKMIIAGAAVVGTAVAAYGGYKLYQLNKQATEGLSNDYHKKATVKFTEANKLFAESEGNHSLGFKTYNNDLIKKSVEQNYKGHEKRAEAESLQDIAKSKKFSVGEKAAYLKQQNKLASEASALAKSVTAEGPKSFSKSAQNGQSKQQLTQQKLQAAQKVASSGSKVVQSSMKIRGQEIFTNASKLNDDYVMQMLEKNKTIRF